MPPNDTASHLEDVRARIKQAEKRYSRQIGSVELLAVSKTKPVSLISQVVAAGQLALGENYVDEGVEKIIELDNSSLVWHYIGHIQSNKTKLLATHYDWVQSVDRLKIARRLAEHRPPDRPPINICIQLKIDDEDSKSGCSTTDLEPLAAFIDSAPQLTLRGIMAIPAPREDFEQQRQIFAELHNWYEKLRSSHPTVDTLSMGMSGDMDAAIAEGATMVRIGTAVFGSRQSRK